VSRKQVQSLLNLVKMKRHGIALVEYSLASVTDGDKNFDVFEVFVFDVGSVRSFFHPV